MNSKCSCGNESGHPAPCWSRAYGQTTERAEQIRRAAIAADNGETIDYPKPIEPTEQERHYLSAIALFRDKRGCAGQDELDAGDAAVNRDSFI